MKKCIRHGLFLAAILFSMQLSAAGPVDFEAIKKAAEQGGAVAQSKLASAYYLGKGVTADRKQAAVWYNKAADQGDLDSMVMMAAMSDGGLGVSQSTSKGTTWYQKAANSGHEPSKGVLEYYTDQERPLKAMQIAYEYSKRILKKK